MTCTFCGLGALLRKLIDRDLSLRHTRVYSETSAGKLTSSPPVFAQSSWLLPDLDQLQPFARRDIAL